jgi:hypothetical protein
MHRLQLNCLFTIIDQYVYACECIMLRRQRRSLSGQETTGTYNLLVGVHPSMIVCGKQVPTQELVSDNILSDSIFRYQYLLVRHTQQLAPATYNNSTIIHLDKLILHILI